MNRPKRLIVEIHRRSLWQVLGIYVVGGWIAFQVAQTLTEGLGLPDWFPGVALGLLIVLLPVVLATAFVQEGVRGPRRPEAAEAPVREARGAHHRIFTWRNAGLGFVIALGLWGVVATGWLLLADRTEPERMAAAEETRKSIAVLPFVNLSEDPTNEYFSDGVTVEIIDRLSKIADLTVKSRTSSFQYKDTDKSLREIAGELGVAAVVEGEVRRVGDRVRINAQLIDADTDEHLWSEQYDRELTDVFAIQSDVAQQVATALRATLTAAEQERIEARPTENLEAYDYYLRGQDLVRSRSASWTEAAARSFTHAIELDPEFALAYARLSFVNAWVYWWTDRTEEPLARAWSAAESALRIDPDLAEGHLALALLHYWGERDYDDALRELDLALRAKPNDSEILYWTATVLRRAGKFEEAETKYLRATELDPLSVVVWTELGRTQRYLRKFEAAEETWRRRATLLRLGVTSGEIAVQLWGKGSTAGARRLIEERSAVAPWRSLFLIALCERRYSAALEVLAVDLPDVREQPAWVILPALFRGQVYALMNDEERSKAEYDSARMILEPLLQERPDDDRLHAALGIAYAGLGRKTEAIEEGRRATELMPLTLDALNGSNRLIDLAEIYSVVGEVDAAIDVLEQVLS
ncbi:MAG: hypothetical protein JSW46_02810, partial [Gemmatimonadota bacterium]